MLDVLQTHSSGSRKLRARLKAYVTSNEFGLRAFGPLYNLWRYGYVYRPWLSDEKRLKQLYRMKIGRELDLQNPARLSEKIQWLKIHDRSDLHVLCADKIRMREYVAETVGAKHVVPLFFTTANPADITAEALPDEPVVVKVNNDNDRVFLIRDKNAVDYRKMQTVLRFALWRNLYWVSREWQYNEIRPRVLVEKMLGVNVEGGIPDFKIFCMNGRAQIIQVDSDRFGEHKRNLYDLEWRLLDVQWGYPNAPIQPRPVDLSRMLDIAQELARPFLFVRVDLYLVEDDIFVGELTFHPTGGLKRTEPQSFDAELGALLELPIGSG